MDDAPAAACPHGWTSPGPLTVIFIIDDWQGLTDGLIRCELCSQTAYVNVIDWTGRNLQTRVFSVACLDDAVVDVFLRNMNSEYCDLQRHQAEVGALIAARSTPETIILTDQLSVIASKPVGRQIPLLTNWRERIPNGSGWLTEFGYSTAK